MKRAFLQKVKSVSCHSSKLDAMVGQFKQTLPRVRRRTRTSAAMIGLALSMGASSLLIPRQNDGAAAAESVANKSATTAVSLSEQVVGFPQAEGVELAAVPTSATARVEHIVREGQTLWQIARRYRVDVDAIASINGLNRDSVLSVGQTLKVPISGRVSGNVSRDAVEGSTSDPVSTATDLAQLPQSSSEEVNQFSAGDGLTADVGGSSSVKAERDGALDRLRQERNRLRNSLAELRMGESEQLSANTPKGQTQGTAEPGPVGRVGSVNYQVKPGDTLGAIAHTYSVPQRELADTNGLANPDWLRVNQSLVIPQSRPSSLTSQIASASGQIESIPAPSAVGFQPTVVEPEVYRSSSSVSYRVHPEDTVAEIARVYDVSRASLANANQLSDPNLILVGQVIQIPTERSTRSAALGTLPGVAVATGTANDSSPEPSTAVTVPTVPMVPPASAIAVRGNSSAADTSVSRAVLSSAPVEMDHSSGLTQQVATIPLSVVPASGGEPGSAVHSASQVRPNQFVENLMTEIFSLRDRYVSERSGVQATAQQSAVVAAAPSALPSTLSGTTDSSRINPEFSPDRYVDAAQTESSAMQQRQASQVQPQTQTNPQLPAETPSPAHRLVAVAPLGSESYAPLVQPITGRMVSPELPPLPGANAYLPDSPMAFNGYIWPARGVLTSGYGWRWGRMHKGIDIGAPIGTPVHAAASGVVEFASWNSGGYGNMVDIRHPDGSVTRYAHNSRLLVRAGQQVEQGDLISEVGSTGYSTGPHLHFEVHPPNQGAVNPIAYLPRR